MMGVFLKDIIIITIAEISTPLQLICVNYEKRRFNTLYLDYKVQCKGPLTHRNLKSINQTLVYSKNQILVYFIN